MSHRDPECERLMKELLQLEEEAHALDLRDRLGWETHQQKIAIMRERIASFEKQRQRQGV
jgi:hypothetical protein